MGDSGLNITACNHVILMEPWWNPYVEASSLIFGYNITPFGKLNLRSRNKPSLVHIVQAKTAMFTPTTSLFKTRLRRTS